MSFYLVLVTTSIALIYFIYQWAKLADRVDTWRAQQHDRLVQYRIDQLRGHGFYAEMFNDFNIFKKNYEQIPDLF